MNTFLEHVATDLLNKYGTDMAHITVVFPNKRAALFLNQALARLADGPVWSPVYITISDFFRQHSELTIADPIKSICDLYKSYIELLFYFLKYVETYKNIMIRVYFNLLILNYLSV